jgi:hypothetical protein
MVPFSLSYLLQLPSQHSSVIRLQLESLKHRREVSSKSSRVRDIMLFTIKHRGCSNALLPRSGNPRTRFSVLFVFNVPCRKHLPVKHPLHRMG